jgi:hypothetical protein
VNRNVLRWFVLMPVVAGIFFLAGLQVFSVLQPARQSAAPPPPPPLTGLESIFVALETETVPVPVDRDGNGGALTCIGDDLVVMTHEGRFFDVGGSEAIELDIAPPPNGYDAMLAFEAANPDYSFAHYYFRYNDVDLHDARLIVSFTEWVEDGACYRTTLASAPTRGAGCDGALHLAGRLDAVLLDGTLSCPEHGRSRDPGAYGRRALQGERRRSGDTGLGRLRGRRHLCPCRASRRIPTSFTARSWKSTPRPARPASSARAIPTCRASRWPATGRSGRWSMGGAGAMS